MTDPFQTLQLSCDLSLSGSLCGLELGFALDGHGIPRLGVVLLWEGMFADIGRSWVRQGVEDDYLSFSQKVLFVCRKEGNGLALKFL